MNDLLLSFGSPYWVGGVVPGRLVVSSLEPAGSAAHGISFSCLLCELPSPDWDFWFDDCPV